MFLSVKKCRGVQQQDQIGLAEATILDPLLGVGDVGDVGGGEQEQGGDAQHRAGRERLEIENYIELTRKQTHVLAFPEDVSNFTRYTQNPVGLRTTAWPPATDNTECVWMRVLTDEFTKRFFASAQPETLNRFNERQKHQLSC